MSTSGTTSMNPSLYSNPGYDPRRDFTPIGLISSTPIALMAHPAFPAKSLADVIAFAKARPGKLNVGTPPPGTLNYLAANLNPIPARLPISLQRPPHQHLSRHPHPSPLRPLPASTPPPSPPPPPPPPPPPSIDEMFSPPEMMMSLERSLSWI